jgi:hypothetical protein
MFPVVVLYPDNGVSPVQKLQVSLLQDTPRFVALPLEHFDLSCLIQLIYCHCSC